MNTAPLIDPDYCFIWNDHWEIYDPTKSYPKGVFTANYRGPQNQYINKLVKDAEQSYIVACERISDEERKKLAPFCQCSSCKSWANIFINTNGSYLGCLTCDNGEPSDEIIKTARISYLKHINKMN
jgi:hypothetical protein